jgi:hypothetical protein
MVIFFAACSDKKKSDSDLLSPTQMEHVLKDMIAADILAGDYIKRQNIKNDTIENLKMQLKIFEHHKITREKFLRSYDYYLSHPEQFQVVLDSMRVHHDKLEIKKDSEKKEKIYEKSL